MKLTVGQKVWFQPWEKRHYRKACELTVTKVGRKWVTFSDGKNWEPRAEVGSLSIDGCGHSSPGRIWEDCAAYNSDLVREQSYNKLRQLVTSKAFCPSHLTTWRITEIIAEIEGKQ